MRLKRKQAVILSVQRSTKNQAVGTVIAAVKMTAPANQQIRSPIKAAENREVAEGRADVLVDGVFHENLNMQLIVECLLGDRQTEAGIASLMRTAQNTVYIDSAVLIRRIKGEEQPLAFRSGDFFFVNTEAFVLIVIRIPGVGECNSLRREGVRRENRGAVKPTVGKPPEQPGIVERNCFHRNTAYHDKDWMDFGFCRDFRYSFGVVPWTFLKMRA